VRPSRFCHVEQVARDGDASRGSQSLDAIRVATLSVQHKQTLVEAINDTHAAVRQCSDVPRPLKLFESIPLAAHRRYQSQHRGWNSGSGKRFFRRCLTERQLNMSAWSKQHGSSVCVARTMLRSNRHVCACVAQGGEHSKASQLSRRGSTHHEASEPRPSTTIPTSFGPWGRNGGRSRARTALVVPDSRW
jgi:hypothetical protein